MVPFDSLAIVVALAVTMVVAVAVAMTMTVIMGVAVAEIMTMTMAVIVTGRRSRRGGSGAMLILAGDGNVGSRDGTLRAPKIED